jgi:hypothetical protein
VRHSVINPSIPVLVQASAPSLVTGDGDVATPGATVRGWVKVSPQLH